MPRRLFHLLLLSGLSWFGSSQFDQAVAQSNACAPPRPGEYILLVLTETTSAQRLLQRSLPQNTPTTLCRYLEDVVTRVGGFSTLESADNWGRFTREIVGLYAVVVESSEASTPPPLSQSGTYNPQPLGEGYAVLVDFFNQPEIAAQVQQTVGQTVGLASYFSRPYLLAIYTPDEAIANATLRRLSEMGFGAVLVDSRRVILLSPTVNYP
ncbi:MAG: hypothetical protein SAJ12_08290 [Jaaginema sp. PMC 1079.18]|nr:hypothetical protein [Jaaginema sp. PMC 1079.18]